ncbi:MAG: hypothetical protein AABY22_34975, partial [Nanoarchaeota archaeon]
VKEGSSTNLTFLTYETSIAAGSLSQAIGPPLNPWKFEAEALKLQLNRLEAKLDQKIENFRERNDRLAGKDIEGTGLVSMSYISFIVGLIVLGLLLWFGLKIAGIFYPPISVGTRLAQIPLNMANKGLSEVISGVESFKNKIKDKINDPELQKQVLETIKTELERKQSPEIQSLIQELTKK